MLCGFLLGWLLTRTNPKVPLLVTIGLQIAGVLWVLSVPGYWFLLAFGLNGAGELFGVYYLNYPVRCSAKWQVRRNIAFLVLISTFVGVALCCTGGFRTRGVCGPVFWPRWAFCFSRQSWSSSSCRRIRVRDRKICGRMTLCRMLRPENPFPQARLFCSVSDGAGLDVGPFDARPN